MKNTIKTLTIVFILVLIAGCASTPKKEIAKIFYPEPPVPARLQFLTSLTGEKDISSKRSAFETFVTGAQESRNRLDKPYGVAAQKGKIYVSDVNNSVMIFDLEKREYRQLQGAQGLGKLIQPLNIRIDAEGFKYVADPIRAQVIVFDKNDFYVTSFSSPDTWKPVDAVVYDDQLYVADIKNALIVVMNKKTGNILRRFGKVGEPKEHLVMPTNLAFDSTGNLYVSDAGRFQLVKFDRDGHYLGTVGDLGSQSGTFARPRGIALDRQNRMYAVDAAFDNVQLFNSDGNLLLFFAKPGKDPGDLYLAAQVIVDYDNIPYFQKYADPNFEIEYLVIVSSQFGDQMINIYGYGKERGKKYQTDEELRAQLKERLKKADKDKSLDKKDETVKEK